jgi:hypothetical protein
MLNGKIQGTMTPDNVAKICSIVCGVPYETFISKRRGRRAVVARWLAAYVLNERFSETFIKQAAVFHRDRTSVSYALDNGKKLMNCHALSRFGKDYGAKDFRQNYTQAIELIERLEDGGYIRDEQFYAKQWQTQMRSA